MRLGGASSGTEVIVNDCEGSNLIDEDQNSWTLDGWSQRISRMAKILHWWQRWTKCSAMATKHNSIWHSSLTQKARTGSVMPSISSNILWEKKGTTPEKKRILLLSSCGAASYILIFNLVAPEEPTLSSFCGAGGPTLQLQSVHHGQLQVSCRHWINTSM